MVGLTRHMENSWYVWHDTCKNLDRLRKTNGKILTDSAGKFLVGFCKTFGSLAKIVHGLGKIMPRSCQDLGKHIHVSWQAYHDSLHWVLFQAQRIGICNLHFLCNYALLYISLLASNLVFPYLMVATDSFFAN